MASDKKLLSVLSTAPELVIFQPTADQRKAKSNFWSYWAEGGAEVPPTVSLATAVRFGGDKRISLWWDTPEFQEWFTNKDEFRQRLEYLSHLVLDTFEKVLTDPASHAGAKVQAGKTILEAAKKMPRGKDEERYADEKISRMDRRQLEEFIRNNLTLLPPQEEVLTVSPSSGTLGRDK